MKTILTLLALALSLTGIPAFAHEENTAGPNGGRLLKAMNPEAEFIVTPERKVRILFLDAEGATIAPAGQSVTVTTGSRAAPTTLTFALDGNALISDQSLPEGDGLPTVVQIKSSPDARATVERFTLHLAPCPECKNPEYACTCSH